MSIVVIYHHADFDGIFSRETARVWLDFNRDVKFIGWDYGEPKPKLELDDLVYMIDISVEGLMDHPNLVWIDHHKSAIEKYSHLNIAGYRIDGVAACRLAWQWFSRENQTAITLPNKEDYVRRYVNEPLAITLAGEYDIWNKSDPRTDLFQYGLGSRDINFDALLKDDSTAYVDLIVESGKLIKFFVEKSNSSIVTKQAFDLKFEGFNFIAVNAARYNSMLFEAAVKPEHDGCLGFHWDGQAKTWKISMYGVPHHKDYDFSVIASKYGGGGHKQACGFRCKTLPFELRPLEAQVELKGLAFIESFTALAKAAHANSRSKGFWDVIDSLRSHPNFSEIEVFWKLSRHDLIHSEVSECTEGVRKDLKDDHLTHRSMEVAELADVIIRIMDYAGAYELPLAEVVLEKMTYNTGRPFMHGDKRA